MPFNSSFLYLKLRDRFLLTSAYVDHSLALQLNIILYPRHVDIYHEDN